MSRQANLARRARLVERAAVERNELAADFQVWEGPLRLVDHGLALVRGLRQGAHFLAIGLAVAGVAVAATRPRQITHWFWGGLAAWRLMRSAGGLLAKLSG